MALAQCEVQKDHPNAWALMCDTNGDIAEGSGGNFFAAKDGKVITPTKRYVLARVSRQIVMEICENLGITLNEEAISPISRPVRRYNGALKFFLKFLENAN